jgi:GH15 family glucan-1,4-alpha-glucosidase
MQAWNAFDAAVQMVDDFGFDGERDRWRATADRIRDDVLANAWDAQLGAFTGAYGSRTLDASVLVATQIGFLPPDDPRLRSTIAAFERTLLRDGFVYRTSDDPETDTSGAPGEGAFLPCTLWLADAYVSQGRIDDARALFERVAALAGPAGLLSEEVDVANRRLAGNIPQTLTHASLVNTAFRLR